jgi:gliding motility-associated-like protein
LDSDNDGINDISESGLVGADSDNDGFADSGAGAKAIVDRYGVLNFIAPSLTGKPFPNITDTDGDGVPNFHDLDSDNDGIFDVAENNNPDTDNDGFIGRGKPVVNEKGQAKGTDNGVAFATKSILIDWDGDGVPDCNDLDSDNDGIHDVTEGNNPDGDGNGNIGTGMPTINIYGVATGGDGGISFKPTSNPVDTDGDLVPDFRDRDSDNDGINDVVEGGNTDRDNDGVIGFGTPVINGKGQATGSNDGLPLAPTSRPTDTDADGIPDFRDLDSDGDKISDVVEGGNEDPDGDNIIGFGKPSVNKFGQVTADAKGKPLVTTSNPTDSDGDKKPDYQDTDSDGDCLSDLSEGTNDADADGKGNYRDIDRDGDGIKDSDECENCATGGGCIDTDKDGIPDVDDLDSDGDGLSDKVECPTGINCPDSNGNGIPDWRDPRCSAEAALANIKGNGTYCTGSDIELSATNTSAITGNITYTWDGPAGYKFSSTVRANQPLRANFTATTASQSGTYTLTTSGGAGCTAVKQSVNVVVTSKLPSPSISAGRDTLCTGSSLSLRASSVSDPNYKYDWYFNNLKIRQTDTNILLIDKVTAANSGSYWVKIITGTGCDSDTSVPVRITVRAASLNTTVSNSTTPEKPACEGGNVQLNVPFTAGATYQWFGPNGFSSNINNPLIKPVTAQNVGDYSVQITANGCTAVSNKTAVYINPKPEKPAAQASATGVCAGTDVVLSTTKPTPVPAGATIKWYKNNIDTLISTTTDGKLTLPKATTKNAGNYFAIYEFNGCPSDASNGLALAVNETPKETAQIVGDLLYTCGADAYNIKAITPLLSTGIWSANGITIQNPRGVSTDILGLKKGKNTIIWSLSAGACKDFSRDTMTLVYEDDIEAKPDSYKMPFNTKLENNVSLNDAVGNTGKKRIDIAVAPTKGVLTIEQDGRFRYEPKLNAFGKDKFVYKVCNTSCPGVCDTAVVNITISGLDQNDGVFIPNIITPNGDSKNDVFKIPAAEELGNMELIIYDRWGQRVYSALPYKNDWRGTYNDKPLPAGTYYYLLKLRPTDENCLQGCINIVR